MAQQQPANAFASHLINQTLSSIALLESLSIINPTDATLIRQKLPSPTGPFPSLALQSTSPSASFSQLNLSQSSPTSWTVRHAQEEQIHPQPPPALPPRGRPEAAELRAKALWDFSGTAADDLQFRSGDIIVIDEEVNDTWYRGRVIPQGHSAPLLRAGLFPANYVEKLPPPPTQYYSSPPPGPQAMVPYQPSGPMYGYDQKPPMQGQMQMMPPQQQVQGGVMVQQDSQNKGKFGKIGSQLGNAAVTGAGFGFGSAVASEMVHAIF